VLPKNGKKENKKEEQVLVQARNKQIRLYYLWYESVGVNSVSKSCYIEEQDT
jgi:hypothetical protein